MMAQDFLMLLLLQVLFHKIMWRFYMPNLLGVPIYKRNYWLAKLTENYNLIAVSGSHGKSTTASMLAYVLKAMGDGLTAIVGAHVPQFPDRSIINGGGKNFVLEADEYDGCFLGLSPSVAVVTNLDWEHVEIFEDEDAVKSIFRRFLKQIRVGGRGHLVICGDSVREGVHWLRSVYSFQEFIMS